MAERLRRSQITQQLITQAEFDTRGCIAGGAGRGPGVLDHQCSAARNLPGHAPRAQVRTHSFCLLAIMAFAYCDMINVIQIGQCLPETLSSRLMDAGFAPGTYSTSAHPTTTQVCHGSLTATGPWVLSLMRFGPGRSLKRCQPACSSADRQFPI